MNLILICFGIIALKIQAELDVNDPVLDRPRKLPKRYEECQEEPHVHSTPKSYYHSLYYECLDVSTSAIKSRFYQKDFSIHCNLEQILVKALEEKLLK